MAYGVVLSLNFDIGFGIMRRSRINHEERQTCAYFKRVIQNASHKIIGRSFKLAALLPKDLKVSNKKIFDLKDKCLQNWNCLFLISCIVAILCDALLFYLPYMDKRNYCFDIERNLATILTSLRTTLDAFYIVHMVLQFRTTFIAPSKRYGREETVVDPALIAKHYWRGFFIIDLLSILPLPQVVILRYLHEGTGIAHSNNITLVVIVLVQYIPRFVRMFPLRSKLLKGVIAMYAFSPLASLIIYLLLYIFSSHIAGSLWYILGMQRSLSCWGEACLANPDLCQTEYLSCSKDRESNEFIASWRNDGNVLLKQACFVENENSLAVDISRYGIYEQAIVSGVFFGNGFASKYFYCLWWGIQSLGTLGHKLQCTIALEEMLFTIIISISGLLLFAIMVCNMHNYLHYLNLLD